MTTAIPHLSEGATNHLVLSWRQMTLIAFSFHQAEPAPDPSTHHQSRTSQVTQQPPDDITHHMTWTFTCPPSWCPATGTSSDADVSRTCTQAPQMHRNLQQPCSLWTPAC